MTSDATFTTSGQTAFLTFNRAETGNAMTWAMYDALTEACDFVDADASMRAFVIRAASGAPFGTGTDIRQFAAFTSGTDGVNYERRLETCLTRLESVGVPTIAQVEGVAAGAGCAIALACDLRVCTPTARFGVPIARTLGNALSLENCARLVAHFGIGRTKDMLFTGRLIDARDALAAGVVTWVVEPTAIGGVVEKLAAAITQNAPLTLRSMKTTLRQLTAITGFDRAELEALLTACYASQDFREGIAAFLEKREPKFAGR